MVEVVDINVEQYVIMAAKVLALVVVLEAVLVALDALDALAAVAVVRIVVLEDVEEPAMVHAQDTVITDVLLLVRLQQ